MKMTMGQLSDAGSLAFGDGYRTKRSELDDNGYRIIRVADIDNGVIKATGVDFVSYSRKSSIGPKRGTPGDIVLTTKGTVGRVALFESADEDVVYSPQLCYFRVLENQQVDARYLRLWFRSDEFRSQASLMKSNTDMADYINLSDIRSLSITLPPIAEQREIGVAVQALDEVVASSRRVMEISDRLSQLTYNLINARVVAENGGRRTKTPKIFSSNDVL